MADKKPEKTYTIEELINVKTSDQVTYAKFSLLENISGIQIPSENIIFDYIDELKKLSVTVHLTDNELQKYKYKPKLLAYDVYGSTESYFVIMALNNIIDVRDFTSKKIKMLKTDVMTTVVGYIYNGNTNLLNANREKIRGV